MTTSLLPSNSRRKIPAKRVTFDSLNRMASQFAIRRFSVSQPRLLLDDTAIHGEIQNVRGMSGIDVHATDTLEAHDLRAEWDNEPCVKIMLLLEGQFQIDVGGRSVRLDARRGAMGLLLSLPRRTKLIRTSRKGTYIRKVVLTLPPDWFIQTGGEAGEDEVTMRRFLASNGDRTWNPTRHAVALAEQMLNPTPAPKVLQDMALESRAFEIAREALGTLLPQDTSERPSALRLKQQNRAQAIRTFIMANLNGNLALGHMAGALGMSVGSMQAVFKATYGKTIADFSREMRLWRAREMIEKDGASISQAAFSAGYSSAANFSTAFKRQFGLSPSELT